MRNYACLVVFILANLILPISAAAQKQLAKSPNILSAKTVYFDNRTGDDSVGTAAAAQLKKWGRFQIVRDKNKADLIFLLSADPYHGGYIIFANGQTGSVDADGHIQEDVIPNYNRLAPVRDAYLTVIDPTTGKSLWTDSHVWGGLLTGKNSVGAQFKNCKSKSENKTCRATIITISQLHRSSKSRSCD